MSKADQRFVLYILIIACMVYALHTIYTNEPEDPHLLGTSVTDYGNHSVEITIWEDGEHFYISAHPRHTENLTIVVFPKEFEAGLNALERRTACKGTLDMRFDEPDVDYWVYVIIGTAECPA